MHSDFNIRLLMCNSSVWELGQDSNMRNGGDGMSGKLSHSNNVLGARTYLF